MQIERKIITLNNKLFLTKNLVDNSKLKSELKKLSES